MRDFTPAVEGVLTAGTRGKGERAGVPGFAVFTAGRYPACSRHGAMNALGGGVWRCLAAGCNVGLRWERVA